MNRSVPALPYPGVIVVLLLSLAVLARAFVFELRFTEPRVL
jgi:hypothetical protein